MAGLVAAALLFGVGWWVGHRGATLSDPERTALVARNNSLRAAHDSAVAVLVAQAAAAQDSARRMANDARKAEAGRATSTAMADSLAGVTGAISAELAAARTLADSFAIRTRELAARTNELHQAQQQVKDERAIAADWQGSYLKQLEASAKLQERIAKDSTRIVELEGTVEDLSKPARMTFDLLGLRTTCGPAASYGTKGADIGVACVASL